MNMAYSVLETSWTGLWFKSATARKTAGPAGESENRFKSQLVGQVPCSKQWWDKAHTHTWAYDTHGHMTYTFTYTYTGI